MTEHVKQICTMVDICSINVRYIYIYISFDIKGLFRDRMRLGCNVIQNSSLD